MKLFKLLRIQDKFFEQDKKIYKAYKMIIDGDEELKKRIEELERIVHNQPLIKKYQKTLDIFLKNAQTEPVPMPKHCCTGMTMEEWELTKNNK